MVTPQTSRHDHSIFDRYFFHRACLLFSILLASHFTFAASSNQPDHIGTITSEALLQSYQNFARNYESHKPSPEVLSQADVLKGKHVVVLFGTWCHDSVREVPRLLKSLDTSEVELGSLSLFGVNRYKSDPEGFSAGFDLRYTPTFIVLDGPPGIGQEVARVIEKPKVGLIEDMTLQIRAN